MQVRKPDRLIVSRRLLGAGGAAVCFLLTAGEALGQPSPRERARVEVAEGAKLFEGGRFASALARFQAAQALYPSGKVYFNVALAHRQLGQAAAALTALRRFLRDPGDTTPELLAEGRALVEQLSTRVASLAISSDVEDGEVVLDGVVVSPDPTSGRFPVDPGPHQVLLRSRAHGTRSATFQAVAGQSLDLEVPFKVAAGNQARSLAQGQTPSPGQTLDRPSGAAEAEALIRQARELREAGKDARAYPLLQKAYEAETTPRTAAQLGLVEIQLGYWIQAERHLTESLSARRDPWVASNRADLEASLSRAKAAIGEVTVKGTPAGATVSVNGWVAGTLPLPVPIRAGEGPLHLEIRALGYSPFRRSLTMTGGQRQEVTVGLERGVDSTPGPDPNASGEAAGSAGASLAAQPIAGSESEPSRSLMRPVGWGSGAAGLSALGFGVYQTLSWRKKFEEFESHEVARQPGQASSTPRDCGAASPNRGAVGCDRIFRDLQRAKTLAIAGYAVGGALAAGGVALLLLAPRDRRSFALACLPLLTSQGASCQVSF